MPESPPPAVAASTDGSPQETLTADAIEALLADFRTWLEQVASAPAAPALEPEPEPIDLHTLLGQFLALRHEVNLQTRATRAQQELNAETLDSLSQALEALRKGLAERREEGQQAQDDLVRPFVKTLLDMHDALALARREVQRVQETILPSLEHIPAALEAVVSVLSEEEQRARSSPWSRWFGGRSAAGEGEWRVVVQEEQARARQVTERLRQLLGSLLTGYTMSVQRLERALEQSGLEPIPAVGQPFDPERMEAVAAVADSGRPAGEVVEEVRPGYQWRGRVFRYAQVSVAR